MSEASSSKRSRENVTTRASHTKSRKGCATCKKRHIRCDEHFPQCRNCSKHQVRCDYMDLDEAGEKPVQSSELLELLIGTEFRGVLDTWRLTGQAPLNELRKQDANYWKKFSTMDLYLAYHFTSLTVDMSRKGYAECVPWCPQMSNLIANALSNTYVMYAFLALSATQLGWQTRYEDFDQLAFHHRANALRQLQEAINDFGEHNTEPILAASMLLSWQALEWRTWVQLQQGMSTVMKAGNSWIHRSELAKYIQGERRLTSQRMPTTPSITGFPRADQGANDLAQLGKSMTALAQLKKQLANKPQLVELIDDLGVYVQELLRDMPIDDIERVFGRFLELRLQVFWLPTLILQSNDSDLGPLAMLAHFFALSLVLESQFSQIGGGYIGSLCLRALEGIQRLFRARYDQAPEDRGIRAAIFMIQTSAEISRAYRAKPASFSRAAASALPQGGVYVSSVASSSAVARTSAAVASGSRARAQPSTSPGAFSMQTMYGAVDTAEVDYFTNSAYASSISAPGYNRSPPVLASHAERFSPPTLQPLDEELPRVRGNASADLSASKGKKK